MGVMLEVLDVVVQSGRESVLAGRLWPHRRRTESATFAYDDRYLSWSGAYQLDPSLPLAEGRQQTSLGRAMFGAFTDSAPDRWGRRLILRAERARVRREGGAPRSFGEADYLLGVRDDLRQGAVRFRDPESGTYLADDDSGVPPLVDLPVLLGAAEMVERDEADEDTLRMLLRGGSSLGGARPKAHVLDGSGRVAIAKFPSPTTDEWDVMRWEAVALQLARAAGISVPTFELHVVEGKAVLVIDRFDRTGDLRIGYVSAMTMLEASDGERGSYLEIAQVIEQESPNAGSDLQELWRRIAFSILISNTDDHLRNHGFLRTSSGGWKLSPAFDLNPNPDPGPKHLSTAIDEADTAARIDTLMNVAPYFDLQEDQARAVLCEVSDATSGWRAVAAHRGLDGKAADRMAPAFEHEQARAAHAIASAGPVSPT